MRDKWWQIGKEKKKRNEGFTVTQWKKKKLMDKYIPIANYSIDIPVEIALRVQSATPAIYQKFRFKVYSTNSM